MEHFASSRDWRPDLLSSEQRYPRLTRGVSQRRGVKRSHQSANLRPRQRRGNSISHNLALSPTGAVSRTRSRQSSSPRPIVTRSRSESASTAPLASLESRSDLFTGFLSRGPLRRSHRTAMEAEPSPGVSPSSLNFPFHQGDFGSFGDLFSQSQSQSHQSHTPPPSSSNHDPYSQHPSPVAPLNQLSPGQQNFADLLAEFTLPGNAMSPQTGESAAEQATGGGGGGYSNAPSPQQQFELSNEVSSQFQQFIAASLASGASNPQQAPIAQKQHFSTPQPLYASHQSSPAASSQTQSLPGSHAPSPMPTYSTSTPTSSMYHAAPTAAPYVVVPNPYSIGPQQYSIPAQQAQLFAQQFAMLQSQGQQQMANVLAQAQAIVQANHLAQQQQQFQHQQRQQQSAGSQSTSADGGEWRENEVSICFGSPPLVAGEPAPIERATCPNSSCLVR